MLTAVTCRDCRCRVRVACVVDASNSFSLLATSRTRQCITFAPGKRTAAQSMWHPYSYTHARTIRYSGLCQQYVRCYRADDKSQSAAPRSPPSARCSVLCCGNRSASRARAALRHCRIPTAQSKPPSSSVVTGKRNPPLPFRRELFIRQWAH